MPQIPDFCIFALRVTHEESVGKKILEANKIYPLLKGYHIAGNTITYNEKEACLVPLYDNYAEQCSRLRVSMSAIVGANGSGKSTLVEFMLRLINNFAASFFGEEELHPGAEHIHFIGNVYGELFFLLDGIPHLLKVTGDKVELFYYRRQRPTETEERDQIVCFERNLGSLYMRNARQVWRGGDKFYTKWRKKTKDFQRIADHFFYTFVSNYSMYAYNAYDFEEEWNSENLEKILRYPHNSFLTDDNSIVAFRNTRTNVSRKKSRAEEIKISREQCCWLEGLFHKNDGYQTPVVLTPYRSHGNMDVNKEAHLSNERLVALLLCNIGYRTLNEHMEVIGLEFKNKNKDYGKDYVNSECDMQLKMRGYNNLRNCIVVCWKRKYHCSFRKSEELEMQKVAIDYLASKTLKVAMKYSQYRKYFDRICNVQRWVKKKHQETIFGLIDAMSKDQSHITTKIRQTLCYLTRGCYSQEYQTLNDAIEVTAASMRSMKEDYQSRQALMFTKYEDVLPAPFINVSIRLKEESGQELKLDKLSSGEKQQIYSISSILYHLSNIGSVHTDLNHKRVAYHRVNIILEEIELYYHPELQREFLLYLLNGLRQIRLSGIKAVSVLIVTHSPFVLSDIPSTNILALQEGKPQERELQSFGANIHDLLNSNFFMVEGSRGKFAELVIREIIKALDLHKKNMEETLNSEDMRWLYNYPQRNLHRLILTIDEPIIQKVLLEKYRMTFSMQATEERIAELERELQTLKQRRG